MAAAAYRWTLFAGQIGGVGFADGAGVVPRFSMNLSMVRAADGSIYIADSENCAIRRISSTGEVTTLAGNGRAGVANGPGVAASFRNPGGIAVSPLGYLVVADTGNDLLRKVAYDGTVSTLAGIPGKAGWADGAAGTFTSPSGVAVAANGDIYVTEPANNLIRKVTPDGVIATYAGVRSGGSADGPVETAGFSSPQSLVFDPSGNLLVADRSNCKIRKITPEGMVSTLAGSGLQGSVDGPGTTAQLDAPWHLAVDIDGSGDLYVTEGGNPEYRLRKVTAAGYVTTVATGTTYGVAMNAAGELVTGHHGSLRRLTRTGQVLGSIGQGRYLSYPYVYPSTLALDPTGYFYQSQTFDVVKISPAGNSSFFLSFGGYPSAMVCANGQVLAATDCRIVTITNGIFGGFAGAIGNCGHADGQGVDARFGPIASMTADAAGNIFVAEVSGWIRRITPSGYVTTLAGTGVPGSDDGPALSASFDSPYGIAVDSGGVVFLADSNNHVIRRIEDGMVTTVAGARGLKGAVDGVGSEARFDSPSRLVVDPLGHLIVVDGGSTVRRISPSGRMTTIGGKYGQRSTAPGVGKAARFNGITDFVISPSGRLYVTSCRDLTLLQGELVTGAAPEAGSVGAVLAESFVPANGAVDPGETVTLPFTLLNGGGAATQNLTATLLSTPGVTPVGPATQGYGAIAAGGNETRPFTLTAQGACGSKLAAVLQLSDGAEDHGRVEFEITLGPLPVVTLREAFENGPGLPAGWSGSLWRVGTYAGAPLQNNFVSNGLGASPALDSPPIVLPAGSNQIRFLQNTSMDAYDLRGNLQISINGGAFVEATSVGTFSRGGYNGRTIVDPTVGWTGFGYHEVAFDLPDSLAGQTVRLRWLVTNAGGLAVDQLELANWLGPRCIALAAPAFTSALPPVTAVVDATFAHQFTAAGNPPPTFSLTAGALPPGLKLSAGGLLSGTPTLVGSALAFPGITVTAANGVDPAVSQVFGLELRTTGSSYLASFGLSGSEAELLADPNFDGVSNLLAYALGLAPALGNATAALPQAQWVSEGGQSWLRLVFQRSSIATDLTYVVEASSDFENWSVIASSVAGAPTTGPGVVGEAGVAPYFQVEVRDTLSSPPESRRFLRLRVTTP